MEYNLLGGRLNFDAPICDVIFRRAKHVVRRTRNPELNTELRELIRFRRKRESLFGPELFADPAWDMLLDLLLAADERRLVSVSSLCIASATPPTTALRWIKTLEEHNFIRRVADPKDKRRIFLSLTADVEQKLKALLCERFGMLNGEMAAGANGLEEPMDLSLKDLALPDEARVRVSATAD